MLTSSHCFTRVSFLNAISWHCVPISTAFLLWHSLACCLSTFSFSNEPSEEVNVFSRSSCRLTSSSIEAWREVRAWIFSSKTSFSSRKIFWICADLIRWKKKMEKTEINHLVETLCFYLFRSNIGETASWHFLFKLQNILKIPLHHQIKNHSIIIIIKKLYTEYTNQCYKHCY